MPSQKRTQAAARKRRAHQAFLRRYRNSVSLNGYVAVMDTGQGFDTAFDPCRAATGYTDRWYQNKSLSQFIRSTCRRVNNYKFKRNIYALVRSANAVINRLVAKIPDGTAASSALCDLLDYGWGRKVPGQVRAGWACLTIGDMAWKESFTALRRITKAFLTIEECKQLRQAARNLTDCSMYLEPSFRLEFYDTLEPMPDGL
jgi:hypothetical protein